MVSSENVAAPLGFPDLSLSLPYADCLRYAQFRLKMIGRGDLKPHCELHDLPYTTIVNLKNGNLKTEEPRLLQRLLRSIDVPIELVRVPADTKSQRFLFPTQQALTTFQEQLECFDKGTPPLPGSQELPTP